MEAHGNKEAYLRQTDRATAADLCGKYEEFLLSDEDCEKNPEKYYDEVYEIDLNTLEPHIVGPHTPDLGRSISAMKSDAEKNLARNKKGRGRLDPLEAGGT